ncbi:MAG: HEAT repeat domain-containing protein, partial [Planctomycetota bacterium]
AERDLLPENGIPRLVMALRSDKPLQRSVAALVLAMRHFRDPGSGVTGLRAALASGNLDQSALIDELLGIVDVREFFPEGGLCHRSALLMLELLSGNGFGADPTRWRSWWQKARHDFRAYRVSLPLDSIAAERMKLGYYVGSRLKFSILGSDAAEPEQGQGGLRFRLTGEAMFALLKDLKRRGMMNIGARLDRAEPGPEKRFLILESREGRVRDGFASSEHPRLKSILLALESLMEREMWQGFCPRDLDADGRREWWKRQSRSMATAEDDAARRDRVLELCCRALPDLDGAGRKRAIGLLLEEAGSRDTRLNPERALGLLSLVDSGKMSNEEDRALLEVVALIKGGNVFAKLLGVISHRPELGTGDLLPRLLALAGPDKIILAMNHRNPSIRESAASQTANLKDSRSYPALLRLLRDASPRVRAAAIRSVGRLGLREAAAALQDLATDADDLVRRAALVALGPVGGKHAFEILHEATTRESAGDRLAAVRGLGKLRDPRTSSVLVKLASAHYPKPLGLQAMLGLKGRGGFELRAMVNQAYQAAQEDELKLEFLFLLGEMQDPRVFQPVLRLMSRGVRQTRCCRILAGISGLDACDSALPERVKTYEKWWRQHHDEGAASWLLLALSRERTKTSLRLDDLEKRATGTVLEELCRIVEKAKNWATRAVAVGLLREHTGRDYGTVQADTSFGAVQALAERYRAYARARSSIGGK